MIVPHAIAILASLLMSEQAWAHATIPGIAGAYAAFTHTLTEPPALLPLLGLGLLVGLHGAEALKWAWAPFCAAMVAGVATTLRLGVYIDPEVPLLLLAVIAGLLAASGLPLPHAVAAVLAVLTGYFFGVFIAPAPASWSTQAYWIVGGLLGASFALVFVVAAADTIRKQWPMPWVSIGLRVVASWIAAISALMFALAVR